MSSSLAKAVAQLPALRTAASSNPSKARELVGQLKILMTEFPSQTGSSIAAPSGEEIAVGREILELALLVSVASGDMKSFERNYAQLRTYYAATLAGSAINDEVSTGRRHVIGLYLMHLLVENRLAEFHSEVELLQSGDRESEYIAFPIRLENFLMEGSYNKILSVRSAIPSPHFASFVEKLMSTARDDIADCAAVSYKSLSLSGAQRLLMLDSTHEVLKYIQASQPGWTVDGDTIVFEDVHKAKSDLESMKLIDNVLAYATEMERIV